MTLSMKNLHRATKKLVSIAVIMLSLVLYGNSQSEATLYKWNFDRDMDGWSQLGKKIPEYGNYFVSHSREEANSGPGCVSLKLENPGQKPPGINSASIKLDAANSRTLNLRLFVKGTTPSSKGKLRLSLLFRDKSAKIIDFQKSSLFSITPEWQAIEFVGAQPSTAAKLAIIITVENSMPGENVYLDDISLTSAN